jgi:integrase
MTVRKDQNGKWMVDITWDYGDGRTERIRKVSPRQTKKSAQKYEDRIKRALEDGKFNKITGTIPLFRDFMVIFLRISKAKDKPGYYESKEKNYRVHLKEVFGEKLLDKITDEDIQKFINEKKERGLKAKTINNILSLLKLTLQKAVDLDVIKQSPKVELLTKEEEPKIESLTFEESKKLVFAADPEWRPFIVTALRTGLRAGELIELKWSDLDFESRKIGVNRSKYRGNVTLPKGNRTRSLYMHKEVATLLGQLPKKSSYVFCDEDGGQLTYGKLKWPLWRACKAAGLTQKVWSEEILDYENVERRIGWHVLRHSFCYSLIAENNPISVVQALMGHADVKTTERYINIKENDKLKAIDSGRNFSSSLYTFMQKSEKEEDEERLIDF